ncbi:putative bifunctional diguanylate cyclase/phosphodiesterase [Spirochaeta dissipatitropha]
MNESNSPDILITRQQLQIDSLKTELDSVRMQKIELEHQLERTTHRRHELERILSLHEKTGLPTHYRLKTEMKAALDMYNSSRDEHKLAIFILQLDKTIETLQRTAQPSVSEWILYELGSRFLQLLEDEDQVFHTRDSEFVFMLRIEDHQHFQKKLNMVYNQLREPFFFSNIKVNLDGTTGISFYPDHGVNRSTLLRHADVALGAAFEQRISSLVFHEQLLEQVIAKADLQHSIIRAIEAHALENIGKQFSLVYQPKYYVSEINERHAVVSSIEAEVLMRWHHPEKGEVPPDRFIPLAEETGLIEPMGKWVLYEVERQKGEWGTHAAASIPLAVNISARQLSNNDIYEVIENMIINRGLKGSDIICEITETSIFDNPNTARNLMERLCEIGVRISLDDFGTGFSSLSYLSRFPLHEIKIDRSFISRLADHEKDHAIISSVCDLAKRMGWVIVAEGVETEYEFRQLFKIGIRCFQGYFLGRPFAPSIFAETVERLNQNEMLLSF